MDAVLTGLPDTPHSTPTAEPEPVMTAPFPSQPLTVPLPAYLEEYANAKAAVSRNRRVRRAAAAAKSDVNPAVMAAADGAHRYAGCILPRRRV